MRRVSVFLLMFSIPFLGISPLASPNQGADERAEPKGSDWELLLPEGDGRDYVVGLCQSCHPLKVVVLQRSEESKWGSIVREMDGLGTLKLEEDEINLIAKYLAQHFSPTHAPLQIRVDLNTASAAQLSRLPRLTKEDAERIVSAREKNAIKTLDDLKSVLSDDQISKIKPFVAQR